METKAHHVLIGGFVLAFVAAIFFFVIWLARIDLTKKGDMYDIYFFGSVAGLGVGGDVRFNGVKVGSVNEIELDADDPQRVKVTIEVEAGTPVRTDSYAQLDLQGITGVSFVQIVAGTSRAPLMAQDGASRPVILSRSSNIAKLVEGAPQLIGRMIEVVDRIANILNPDTQADMVRIVADLRKMTEMLSSRDEAFGRIIDNFDQTSGEVAAGSKQLRDFAGRLNKLAADAEKTMAGLNALTNNDARAMVSDIRQTTQSVNALTKEVHGLIAENRRPIGDFATDGLADFRRLLDEARILVGNLQRVANRLEDNPSQIFFGARDSEFRPNSR